MKKPTMREPVQTTVTNCTTKEATSRISNIQFRNHIMQVTSPQFVCPRFKVSSSDQNNVTLPLADEIHKEIKFCRSIAIATATKCGLIQPSAKNQQRYGCKIKPFTSTTASKQRAKHLHKSSSELKHIKFTASDLKNIQLKNYGQKISPYDISTTGPYVNVELTNGNITIVKNTSLCWLFENECKKLSNDRPLRVMTSTPNAASQLKKQFYKQPRFHPKKRISIKKKRKKEKDLNKCYVFLNKQNCFVLAHISMHMYIIVRLL